MKSFWRGQNIKIELTNRSSIKCRADKSRLYWMFCDFLVKCTVRGFLFVCGWQGHDVLLCNGTIFHHQGPSGHFLNLMQCYVHVFIIFCFVVLCIQCMCIFNQDCVYLFDFLCPHQISFGLKSNPRVFHSNNAYSNVPRPKMCRNQAWVTKLLSPHASLAFTFFILFKQGGRVEERSNTCLLIFFLLGKSSMTIKSNPFPCLSFIC